MGPRARGDRDNAKALQVSTDCKSDIGAYEFGSDVIFENGFGFGEEGS
jgi:hypothetical protein